MQFVKLADGRLIPGERVEMLIPTDVSPELYDVKVAGAVVGQALVAANDISGRVLPAAGTERALIVIPPGGGELGTIQQVQIVGWRLAGAKVMPIVPNQDGLDEMGCVCFVETPSGYIAADGREMRAMTRDEAIRWAYDRFAEQGIDTDAYLSIEDEDAGTEAVAAS